MKRLTILAAGLAVLLVCGRAGDDASQLRLVPFPKEVRIQAGALTLDSSLALEVAGPETTDLARVLNEELKRADLRPVRAGTLRANGPAFRLAAGAGESLRLPLIPEAGGPEAYGLEVRPGEIVCAARAEAGLFHGLQTVCQLIRANRRGPSLPCLEIQDWPSLRWRAFQDDMTRGPSSSLDTLKQEVALGAYFKLNLMTFYMEYQYAFSKHPKIWPRNGSLTPDELSALVAYARPLQVDILGNQQSFGHFGWILKHPEYAALRENEDVLSPAIEGTYQLLDDLYSDVCPRLPFPFFNVCCDETWGLGSGPSRDLVKKLGVGGVYVQHVRRVHDLLQQRYQKRMMMWGDIILQHPDKLGEIPRDTIMLTWGYDARPSFEDQIIPFAKSGFEFFVCPGVANWSRILPDFGVATTNIWHFVRDGVKHGALGMINTDWEDDGEAINAVKWHADAWASECAWNGSVTRPERFNRRVGAVLFGESGDHFGQAIELLARTHRIPAMKGMLNARFWAKDFAPATGETTVQNTASNLLAIVRPAQAHLEACRREARCNQHVLDTLLFGARRMELIGQRMLDGLAAARLYEQAWSASLRGKPGASEGSQLTETERLVRRNREAHQALGSQFAALWLAENKPYALDWTLRRYTNTVSEYDQLLQKLAQARAALTTGQALPTPEEVGLAIAKPLSRQIRPAEILAAPLAPATPWADASASHRLGLTLRTKAADRFNLPLEVPLALPPGLTGKPIRTFLIAPGKSRELLAQLDATGKANEARLVLILEESLPKDSTASLHVYLGLSSPVPMMPRAVTTGPGQPGTQWIENNRVRLLLGGEGAHVYRWEVKAAGGRDLTMPGETGWAGFSDAAEYRGSPYQLRCTAQGPALVEYECSNAAGHRKVLRLYGGASWMEVFLDEPTPLYWDFDDPKNFAADGPTPGAWLFSDGKTGKVGREAEGVPAQVKAPEVFWGIKFNPAGLALGLVTPETKAFHHIAPGAGAGGVGIENSRPAAHFITFGGVLEEGPAETMNRLRDTLDLQHPVAVTLHGLEKRP